MKWFNLEAERYLFHKLQSLASSPSRWRMLQLNTHVDGITDAKGLGSQKVLSVVLREVLSTIDCSVYILINGQIVILLDGPVTPLFDAISSRLHDVMPNLNHVEEGVVQHEQGYCTYYDLALAFGRAVLLADRWLADYERTLREEVAHTAAKENQENLSVAPLWNASAFQRASSQRAVRSKPCVLIIEDDSFTARLVGNVLRASADIVEATSGYLGVVAYTRTAPDLVFLDINLPDADGRDLLKEIIRRDADSFIVMLSGNSQKDNVLASLEEGAKGFVGKPFSREKITHYFQMARKKASPLSLSQTLSS